MKLLESINHNRREFFKTATKKEKFKYLADYYGFRTVVFLAVAILATTLIIDACTKPDDILNGTFVNLSQYGRQTASEELAQEFMKELKIDTKKQTVLFDSGTTLTNDNFTDYEMHQALMVRMAGGKIDFIVSSHSSLMSYAYDEILVDLTTILTKEQITKYEPYFLYIDNDIVRQRNENQQTLEELAEYTYPDFTDVENMKDPIPVLIDFSEMKQIQDLYNSKKLNLAFGIVSSGENKENAVKFLDYITK